MSRLLIYLFLLFSVFGTPLTLADYEIEVIVFTNPDSEPQGEEPNNADEFFGEQKNNNRSDDIWRTSVAQTKQQINKMESFARRSKPYKSVDQLNHLESVRVKLLESGYRIINTTSWQQPRKTFNQAPLIALHERYPELSEAKNEEAKQQSLAENELQGLVEEEDRIYMDRIFWLLKKQQPQEILSGFVRVYTTSLIYANIDLQFTPTPESDEPLAINKKQEAELHYFISQKRRLKFQQIHYFDHPNFGAILGIWKAKSIADE